MPPMGTLMGDDGNPFDAPAAGDQSPPLQADDDSASPAMAWTVRGMGVGVALTGLAMIVINVSNRSTALGFVAGLLYAGFGVALMLLSPAGRIAATLAALASILVGMLFVTFNGTGLLALPGVVVALIVLWSSKSRAVFNQSTIADHAGKAAAWVVAGVLLGAAFVFPGACAASFLSMDLLRFHH
jgi:hypothetical protein